MRSMHPAAWQAAPIVLLALHVGAVHALAQSEGAVRGQVVAAADGSALPQSVVTLTSPSTKDTLEGLADAAGRFTFPNLRPGEHILSARADGFVPRELRFVLEPREVRTVTVALDVRRLDVSIDVIGSVAPIPGTHSPSSTTLTLERLESTAIFQRTALPEAIVTLAPGMIRGHDDFVHIRGHEVALNPLINGVSFWENTHATFSAGLSPDVIETANVMTGGFPAEYGNRFGGIVDIVTRSGLRTKDHGGVTVGGGGAGRRRIGGDAGGSRGQFGYFVYGSAFESGRFLSPPSPEAIHDEARGGHAFTQLESGGHDGPGSFRVVLIGDGVDFDIPVTIRDTNLRPLATPRQDARQQTAIFDWMRVVGGTAVRASVYQRWSRTRLHPADGALTARAQLDRRLATVGGKGDVTRFIGRHALKAGVDAVRLAPRETLNYDPAGYVAFTHLLDLPHIHVSGESIAFTGAESGGQVSAYVQDSLRIGSRVTADVGLRVDHHALLSASTHASPRVNLAVRVGDAVAHVSYNRFFVPPPIEGVLSSSAGLTRSIEEIGMALPILTPTVEDQLEAGVARSFGQVEVAVTSYYRATENPVHTTVWPDSRIYSYASFDRARAYGLEAKAEARSLASSGLTGYLNYALGRVYFHNPVTGGFVTEAHHITDRSRFLAPMDQTHTLTGGLTYRHPPTGIWVGGTLEYGSGTPMGHGGSDHEHAPGMAPQAHASSPGGTSRVPGHVTAGGSLGASLLRDRNRRTRLALQLDVENVSNNVYVIAQEGEFSPAQYSIPRLFSVSARLRF